jgi:hypothetical protein
MCIYDDCHLFLLKASLIERSVLKYSVDLSFYNILYETLHSYIGFSI